MNIIVGNRKIYEKKSNNDLNKERPTMKTGQLI